MRALRPSRLFGFCKQDVAILATQRSLPTKGGTVCHVHNQFAIITVLPRGRCPRTPGVFKASGKAPDIRFYEGGGVLKLPLAGIRRHPIRLSLSGLLSSRARLRFTGYSYLDASGIICQLGDDSFIINIQGRESKAPPAFGTKT
jgi:hypothetical protein